MSNIKGFTWLLLAGLALSGCATDSSGQNDPYERANRAIFAVDLKIDHYIARPVAVVYNRAIPQLARDDIHNFLSNLDSPVTLGNDILQGETDRAGQTLGRVVVNSTLGLGGLVDVGARIGILGHEEDFGQTLAVWGVGEGPYLVLPLAGPSTPRDLTGSIADIAMDPLAYAKWHNSAASLITREVFEIVDLRARNVDTLDQIERASVDLYAGVRSFYRQHRNAEIRNGATHSSDLPDL